MSRALLIALAAIVLAALAIGAWLKFNQPPIPPPPALGHPDTVGSSFAQLVGQCHSEIAQSPRSAAARAKLGMVYDANGLSTLAQAAYEQAIMLDRRNSRYWYHLARMQADLGDITNALHSIQQSISLQKDHVPAHWRRGYWLLDLERLNEAQSAFQQAIGLDPNNSAAKAGLARIALQRRQYDLASELIDQVIAAEPNSPNLPYLRQLQGSAQRHLGQHLATRVALSQSQGVAPFWPDPWADQVAQYRTGYRADIEAAQHLIAAGKPDVALTRLESLIQKHPNDARAMNLLAEACFALGQWDRGKATLEQCLEVHPNYFLTHLNLAGAYKSRGDFQNALLHARRAAELNPGVGAAHLEVGQLLVRNKQYNDAVQPLTLAINSGISDPNARVLLAQVHLELKEWRQASHLFEQAARAAPLSGPAYVGLAHAKAELGELDQAKQFLEMARQINPRDPNLQRISARLEQLGALGPPTGSR